MIVLAKTFKKEVVMTALLEDGKYYILVPEGSEVYSHVKQFGDLTLKIKDDEKSYEAFVNDDGNEVSRIFNKFNEEGSNYFKETRGLAVVVCK